MTRAVMMIKKNLELGSAEKISAWRKIAIGTWTSRSDPAMYGFLEFEVTRAEEWLKALSEREGTRVTFTSFLARAMAATMHAHPEINSVLRFGRVYRRKTIDIFVHVAADAEGRDLTGYVVRDADKKSVVEIARELEGAVGKIRVQGDEAYKKSKNLMRICPGFLARAFLDLSSWILYTLNIWSPALGVPRNPFGGAMLTNVGPLGLVNALPPLPMYTRVPMVLAVGKTQEKPVVRNEALAVGRVITIGVTMDHRVVDGVHAGKMNRTFREFFEKPEMVLASF